MKEGTMKRLLKMLWSKYKIHLVIDCLHCRKCFI